MEVSVNERIRQVIQTMFGGNVSAFSKESGVSRTTVNSIIKDGGVSPGYNVIRRIGELSPAVSMDWLILGTGDMYRSGNEVNSHNVNSKVNSDNGAVSEDVVRGLLSQLEEKDRQISVLLQIIANPK